VALNQIDASSISLYNGPVVDCSKELLRSVAWDLALYYPSYFFFDFVFNGSLLKLVGEKEESL